MIFDQISRGKVASLTIGLLYALSSGKALASPPEKRGPKVDTVASPTSASKRPTRDTTLLPSKQYNLTLDFHQLVHNLTALDPRSIEQSASNQVGITRSVEISPGLQGKEFHNADGSQLVMLAIRSPGAIAIRVRFEEFDISPNDEVYVYGLLGDSTVSGPYSGKGLFGDRKFWSSVAEGDTAIIEWYRRGEPGSFRISGIGHLYGQAEQVPPVTDVLACEIDASCSSDIERDAVARILFVDDNDGGQYVCTGTLLNDRYSDLRPFFLTANHCISTQTEAQSIVGYWFYRTTACNSGVLRSDWTSTQGANLYVSDATKDFAFLEGPPAPSGAWFSGWDSTVLAVNTSVHGFHHPSNRIPPLPDSYLRRSDGFISNSSFPCAAIGLLSGYRVSWTLGTTEPGSSGSGLWYVHGNGQHYLGGVLSCGPLPPTCSAPYNSYSKFSDIFPQIKSFLYPQNALTVASSNPNSGVTITVSPNDDDGLGSGTTQFTRKYAPNALVSLIAPATAGGNSFSKWQRDGVDFGITNSISVTMNAPHTLTAVYGSQPTPPPGGSLVVTNTNSQGAGSLASAIANSNANPSTKAISFSLPGSGPWTITASSTLTVIAPVRIDGTSQPGYNGQANRVYVEGSAGVANVFDVRNHGGTTIKGLGIYNYDNTGVMIDNATVTWIEDCYIGFKQTGGGVLQNKGRSFNSIGVEIRGSYNQIHRSTISGVFNGVNIGEATNSGLVHTDNLLEGNRIGTDPTGQTTVGYENTSTGILLRAGVTSSWIGSWTLDPSGFNVVAGNGESGIAISHPTAHHNRIFYNYLGVNSGGTQVITGSTNRQAILINNGAQYNAAWSNIIAGNRDAGIIVASSNNWILGNIIGLNQAQTQALGGQPYGILLRIDTVNTPGVAPQGNAIGGSDPIAGYSFGNVICNQSLNGIEIQNGVSNGVMCNWIGYSTSGQPFPNSGWGAYLLNSSFNSDYGCLNAWGPNGFGRVGGSGGGGNSIQ